MCPGQNHRQPIQSDLRDLRHDRRGAYYTRRREPTHRAGPINAATLAEPIPPRHRARWASSPGSFKHLWRGAERVRPRARKSSLSLSPKAT